MERPRIDPDPVYDFVIFSNWYKELNQWEGNGVQPQFTEGFLFFKNKNCRYTFLIYPFRSVFYLYVENYQEGRLSVVAEDSDLYHRDGDTFLRYASQLINNYKAKRPDDLIIVEPSKYPPLSDEKN